MPFPRNLLNEGEEIVLYRHPHWAYLIGSIAMCVASVIIAVVISIVLPPPINLLGLLLIVFAVIGAAGRYLRWRTTEFVVTTDRIIVRRGVLSKVGIEIPLDRIMNVAYSQALFERILGTGDLVVESAGENGRQSLSDIANPSYVQNVIYRQSELYEAGRSGSVRATNDGLSSSTPGTENSGTGGGRLSIPEQIEKLAALHQKGILSDSEFQAKKKMLLDRM